jgi:hypothetical protein
MNRRSFLKAFGTTGVLFAARSRLNASEAIVGAPTPPMVPWPGVYSFFGEEESSAECTTIINLPREVVL